jgi:hypothetical protein
MRQLALAPVMSGSEHQMVNLRSIGNRILLVVCRMLQNTLKP